MIMETSRPQVKPNLPYMVDLHATPTTGSGVRPSILSIKRPVWSLIGHLKSLD